MVQTITVMLIDDIDQSQAAETVHFGVDGTAYEIDLSARHAGELRSMAARYISVARRIRSAPSRARERHQPRARTRMDREQSRRIRSWAMERGLLASPRGRIPQHVADEYEATMRVASVPFRSPGTAKPEAASAGTTPVKSPSRRRAPAAAKSGPETASSAATQGQGTASVTAVHAGEHHLTEQDRRQLAAIQEHGKPARFPGSQRATIRLEQFRLVEHDSRGTYWLTDHGRQSLASG